MVEIRARAVWVLWCAAIVATSLAWSAATFDAHELRTFDVTTPLVTPAVAVLLLCWWRGWRGLAASVPSVAVGLVLGVLVRDHPSPLSTTHWVVLGAAYVAACGGAGLALRRARVDLRRPQVRDAARFVALAVAVAPALVGLTVAVLAAGDPTPDARADTWSDAWSYAMTDMAAIAVVAPVAAYGRAALRCRAARPLRLGHPLRDIARGGAALGALVGGVVAISLGDARVDALCGALFALTLVAVREERHRSDVRAGRAIAELDIDRARLWSLVDESDDGVLLLDARGHVESVNTAAARLFEADAAALRGRTLLDLVPAPAGTDRASHLVALLSSRRADAGSVAHIWEARRAGGETFPLDLAVQRVGAGEHWGYVASVRDDSDRRRREQQIAHRVTHDPLTQLPNRVLFQDRVEQALETLQHRPSGLALLLIGVQRRSVDRALGRIAGDRVVAEVARRLAECVRSSDTVARIGDDELAVICQPCPGPATAGQLAARLLAHATRPLYGLPAELVPRAHIGVVTTTDAHARPDRLLAEADVALERARGQATPGWCVYRPTIDVRELTLLEIDLRDHLRDRVVVRYQPILDLKTGRVEAVEALARLRAHDGTLISPSEFVPLAERNDLVDRLGEAVLTVATRDLLALRDEEGFEDLRVSVNVSPHQLSDELCRVVADVLAATDLPASALMLEVTESAPIDLLPGALDVLRRLRALGVGIALDDIGTGFSRLDQVRDLPVDTLKVDRTFVRRVVESEIDRDIVRMMVAVGRRRGLAVIAEGVESVEQVDAVSQLGCTHVQGFLFGQPMHVDELRYVLREWHVVPAIATYPSGEGRIERTPSPRITPGSGRSGDTGVARPRSPRSGSTGLTQR